jgi:tetratricopeptide (TPR) repeat protein
MHRFIGKWLLRNPRVWNWFSKRYERSLEATPLSPEREQSIAAQLLERAPDDLAELDAAETDIDRFYALPDAAFGALALGKRELARELAQKALDMAPSYADNWHYGNAIHAAHTVLGLLAVEVGDTAGATDQLARAGATPGSPQLDSFGPSMRLARALAKLGETHVVLTYLKQCRTFWKMGSASLDVWEAKLQRGEVPNFTMQLHR